MPQRIWFDGVRMRKPLNLDDIENFTSTRTNVCCLAVQRNSVLEAAWHRPPNVSSLQEPVLKMIAMGNASISQKNRAQPAASENAAQQGHVNQEVCELRACTAVVSALHLPICCTENCRSEYLCRYGLLVWLQLSSQRVLHLSGQLSGRLLHLRLQDSGHPMWLRHM